MRPEQAAALRGVFHVLFWTRASMRAMHMSVAYSIVQFDASSRALLRAIGIGESLAGVFPALAVARYCFDRASEATADASFSAWSAVTRNLELQLRKADADAKLSLGVHQFGAQDRESPPARFAALLCPQPASAPQQRLSTLLARALISASISGDSLTSTFLDGIHTLQGAIAGKGRRSADWQALVGDDLADPAKLRARAESIGPKSPALPFVLAASKALEQAVASPRLLEEPTSGASGAGTTEQEDDARESPAGYRPSSTDEGEDTSSDERVPMDTTPKIVGRLAAAETASVAEKFGLHHRDYLLPSDFAPITRKLRRLLDSGDRTMQVFAALGLTSALTTCSDAVAVNLRFDSTHTIWLDLEQGTWCWDFQEYRRHVAPGSDQRPRDPIPTALPAPLVLFLRKVRASFPLAETLGAALAGYGDKALDLRAFREFLRRLGNTAHPAYRGRFARSIAYVYLAQTGSDMTAAQATGQFAACAPAALFYFSPTAETRYQRAAKVYSFLGLGEPFRSGVAEARMGAQKVLEEAELRNGWEDLATELNAAMAALRSAEESKRRAQGSRVMKLLCAAFVVQTAHRATRFDCLTFSALYAHPDYVAILDKDEGGRHPGRLLPQTQRVRQILAAAAECHQIACGDEEQGVEADHPVFVTWPEAGGPTCLNTGDIVEVIHRHFQGSDPNFARSVWVTYLDESGCDRWLIRVLTGHTRDVTRTSEPYFDTSPVCFADRLRCQMERVGATIFGPAPIELVEGPAPRVRLRIRASNADAIQPASRVPDPRSLLEGITGETLTGWRTADRVRKAIASADLNASPAVRAVLSLLFVDFIPEAATCLRAVKHSHKYLRRYGNQCGVLWHRPHFIHPTWIPIDASTERLIALAEDGTENLGTQVGKALRHVDDSWPRNARSAWKEVERVQRHFMRIEFPPSLQAMAHPGTPAPALSDLSLMRLALGESSPAPAVDVPDELVAPPRARESTAKPELGQLRELVHPWTTPIERLGELRARAVQLRRKIQEGFEARSLHSVWIYDWIMDELQQSAVEAKGRLDISSIYTYLGVLILPCPELAGLDPYDWTDEEWNLWIDHLESKISGPAAEPERQGPVSERVRHPVGRLVRNLQKRQHYVPWPIRSRLLESHEDQACGSASSTLILDSDIAAARAICQSWLDGRPLDQLMMDARFVGHSFPSRTSEISSLGLDCVTPAGGLLIQREGYKVHKTHNAIRLVLLDAQKQSEFVRLKQKLAEYHPEGADLLLRGDGSAQAGARDVNLARMLTISLKIVTGDVRARIHCLRAKSLQDDTWPGWAELARELLAAGVSVERASTWVSEIRSNHHRLTFSSVQAGHGDLRPALGNYLAAWPLVLHLHARSLLVQLTPKRKMLHQLGANANTYAQAYRRSGRTLSIWDWLPAQGPVLELRTELAVSAVDSEGHSEQAITESGQEAGAESTQNANHQSAHTTDPAEADVAESLEPAAEREATEKPHQSAPHRENLTASSIGSEATLLRSSHAAYLTALVLGIPKPRALEYANLTLAVADRLDGICATADWRPWAVKRARSQPGPRGDAANMRLLIGRNEEGKRIGKEIIGWVCAIACRATLYEVVFRQPLQPPNPERLVALWKDMAAGIPSVVSVVIHRRKLSPAEDGAIKSLGPAASVRTDPNIGAVPLLKLYPRGSDNRVLSSRYTSIFRAAICACAAIDGALPVSP